MGTVAHLILPMRSYLIRILLPSLLHLPFFSLRSSTLPPAARACVCLRTGEKKKIIIIIIIMEDTKMTSSFRIREAVKDDIDVMVRMQQVMAFETEGLRLEEETLRRGITVPFECKNVARFNVAEDTENGKVIAMMMMTYEWSEWRAGWILWIQSVYVLPAWRRRGVFRKLYEHVKRIVQEDASIHGLRLYVERENANAIATYRRLGMKTEHYNMMKWMKSKY